MLVWGLSPLEVHCPFAVTIIEVTALIVILFHEKLLLNAFVIQLLNTLSQVVVDVLNLVTEEIDWCSSMPSWFTQWVGTCNCICIGNLVVFRIMLLLSIELECPWINLITAWSPVVINTLKHEWIGLLVISDSFLMLWIEINLCLFHPFLFLLIDQSSWVKLLWLWSETSWYISCFSNWLKFQQIMSNIDFKVWSLSCSALAPLLGHQVDFNFWRMCFSQVSYLIFLFSLYFLFFFLLLKIQSLCLEWASLRFNFCWLMERLIWWIVIIINDVINWYLWSLVALLCLSEDVMKLFFQCLILVCRTWPQWSWAMQSWTLLWNMLCSFRSQKCMTVFFCVNRRLNFSWNFLYRSNHISLLNWINNWSVNHIACWKPFDQFLFV